MMAAMVYPNRPRPESAYAATEWFMMNSQELETATRLGPNLVVLILQDNAYGMIRWKQAVDSFADWGLTFGKPGDFVKSRRSLRCEGVMGRFSHDGLIPAFGAAFAGGRRPPDRSSHRPLLRKPSSSGGRASCTAVC